MEIFLTFHLIITINSISTTNHLKIYLAFVWPLEKLLRCWARSIERNEIAHWLLDPFRVRPDRPQSIGYYHARIDSCARLQWTINTVPPYTGSTRLSFSRWSTRPGRTPHNRRKPCQSNTARTTSKTSKKRSALENPFVFGRSSLNLYCFRRKVHQKHYTASNARFCVVMSTLLAHLHCMEYWGKTTRL